MHPILKAYTTIFAGSKMKMSQYAWHNMAPSWLTRIWPHELDKEMGEASRVIRDITLNAVEKRKAAIQGGEEVPHDFLAEVARSGKFDAQECADELIILLAAA